MPRKKYRIFDRAMKLATVKRMLAGEDISALARELKMGRAVLYRWRHQYEDLGGQAFRGKPGRPPKNTPDMVRARRESAGELAAARQRVAELERKVGQQQVELDFFRQALRQVGDSRGIDGRGVKASTPSSKR
jgi:transposase